MKLILILAFFIPALCLSQAYIPILDEDNLWSVRFRSDFGYWHGSYFVQGKEEINGNIYHIVYRDNEETNCRWREQNGVLYFLDNTNTE